MTTEIITVEEAVEAMKSATSVNDWNEIRQSIKDEVGEENWIIGGYLAAIDASGLIAKVIQ